MLSPPLEHGGATSGRATCPPEEVRVYSPRSNASDGSIRSEIITSTVSSSAAQQPTPPAERRDSTSTEESQRPKPGPKENGPPRDTPSPMSTDYEPTDSDTRISQSTSSLANPLTPSSASSIYTPNLYSGAPFSPFPSHRVRRLSSGGSAPEVDQTLTSSQHRPNSTSPFLHHGSKFHGTQKSDRQEYDVQVEIKYVDMEESFLCGYLRIQGMSAGRKAGAKSHDTSILR